MKDVYGCIDLKSFFASVEAIERGLDPFNDNLVVADKSRGQGGICLAITPALKKAGVPNRCRLFQIPESVDYIVAKPRMKLYMKYSKDIYSMYLKYLSKDDIHVYSIDECFFSLKPYLKLYNLSPKGIIKNLMNEIFTNFGIASSGGIGENMFLAKLALDIEAKKTKDNIGIVTKENFRKIFWYHRPITDIWGIGKGIAQRLEKMGIFDLYGIATCPEEKLYKEFGVNAKILIEHAMGSENCTILDIHNYIPAAKSISNSQVLFHDYEAEDGWIVVKEMIEKLCYELIYKEMVTRSISLSITYSNKNLKSEQVSKNLGYFTSSYNKLRDEFEKLYFNNVKENNLLRKIGIELCHLEDRNSSQVFLKEENKSKEHIDDVIIGIKSKFGDNSIIRAMSLQENATARERNKLVGGHNGE